MNKNIIGILGGMGPQASCELYKLIIDGARRAYGAHHNDEYPEIILDSIPVPDGFSHPEKMEAVASILEDRVSRLTSFGATTIAIACNTVCVYKNRLQSKTDCNVISTVEEVVKETANSHSNVVLLASSTSLQLRLYQDMMDRYGITYVYPKEHLYARIDSIIEGVLSGESYEALSKNITNLTDSLSDRSQATAVVLGCTELPLIFPKNFRMPVISSLSILAENILKRYYKENI